MSIGQGTRVRMAYIREVTKGVTPATPAMKVWRTISRNLNPKKNTVASQETWADGQVHDLRHGFQSSDGSITAELALSTQDDWLETIMGSLWASDVLKVGTNVYTNSVERQFLDVGKYEMNRGVTANTLEVRVQPDAIVGLTWGLLGMGNGTVFTSASGASSIVAPPANAPFDSFIGTINEGGSPIAVLTGITFTINRGRTLGPVVSSKTSPDVFEGTFMLTGTMSVYFEDHTLATKFLNETVSSATVGLVDPDVPTTGLTFTIPRLKYTGNDKDPPREGGVIQNAPFTALYDPTAQTTLTITRDTTP